MNSSNAKRYNCDYFDEDVVIRLKNGSVQFGIITESAENASDDDSDDSDDIFHNDNHGEDDDYDDDDDDDTVTNEYRWKRVKQGFAKVAWHMTNTHTQLVAEKEVKLYDRSLLHGDVIKRLDTSKGDNTNEYGYCKDVKVIASVRIIGTDKVISDVNCNDLESLSPITMDSLCLLDSWIGYIRDIKYELTLKCSDNSLLIVDSDDVTDFEDILFQNCSKNSEFDNDEHYIGQQLYGHKKCLSKAKWKYQTKEMRAFMESNLQRNLKIKVAVEDVTVKSVNIDWLYCIHTGKFSKYSVNSPNAVNTVCKSKGNANDSEIIIGDESEHNDSKKSKHAPHSHVYGEDLKRIICLNYFEKSSLQISDRSYYTLKESDILMNINEWKDMETEKICENFYLSVEPIDSINGNETPHENEAIALPLDSCDISVDSSISSKKMFKTKSKCKFSYPVKRAKKKKLKSAQRKTHYTLPIKLYSGYPYPIEIISTLTYVTVVWQSGLIEEDIPSHTLYPIHYIDNHDFFTADFVVSNKDDDVFDPYKYGVIQSVNHSQRTAVVKWQRTPLSPNTHEPPIFIADEELSVYEIKDHPDFSFKHGSCIIKISTVASNEDNSKAGQITDILPNGQMKCVWSDLSFSYEYPHEIFVIGEYDSDDLWAESEFYDSASDVSFKSIDSWETDSNTSDGAPVKELRESTPKKPKPNLLDPIVSIRKSLEHLFAQFGDSKTEGSLLNDLKLLEEAFRDAKVGEEKEYNDKYNDKYKSTLISRIQEVFEKFKKKILRPLETVKDSVKENYNDNTLSLINSIAEMEKKCNKILNDLRLYIPRINGETPSVSLEKDVNESNDLGLKQNETQESAQNSSNDSDNQIVIEESRSSISSELQNDMSQLVKNGIFIEMSEVPECHYWKNSAMPKLSDPKRFFRRIKEEITLLQTSLPDDIIVTGFEDRTDLYSVMIIGPKSTPYEDGIFLFDIQLQASYPITPPNVHYISYCSDRLNPNLYENGKVCISLLGTWSGKGTEVWSSTSSNLLQVIVSIQGLILVSEPYYNEAGYMRQRGTVSGHENSRLYNEMAVIKLIESMITLVKNPLKTFEEKIKHHFLQNGEKFIRRHEDYIVVSEICNSKSITSVEELQNSDSYPHESLQFPDFPLLPASQGFCITLKKVISNLKDVLFNYLK